MPASRAIEIEGLLSAEVEGLDFDRQAFFTDEEFEYDLRITNESDRRLTGRIDYVGNTEQTVGLGRPPMSRWEIDIDLPPGETHLEPLYGVGLVGGSGLGVISGIRQPEVIDETEDETIIEPGDTFRPLLSIIFWDREFYRINYLRPRRAQYVGALFGLLSAVFAGIVIMLMM